MNKIYNYVLKNGDCLNIMNEIENKSIDMILADLPYGTTSCKWDSVIDLEKLWEHYNRIIKDNGVIVLFSAQPFTTSLINSNMEHYKYSWYWLKNNVTGFAFAKYQPMRRVEDINVFYKKHGIYNPQGLKKVENMKKRKRNAPKRETIYKENTLQNEYTPQFTNYPKNVLQFNKEVKCVHPTQKPVELLEYLIKTYTNEEMVVLDNCMGSGSTGVACGNTGRRFIGIEKDNNYFKIAQRRIGVSYKVL